MSTYRALLDPVKGRGRPPMAFLDTLVAWLRIAPDEIFAPNAEPRDVMPILVKKFGPLRTIPERRAALGELLRVLAGFESSWDWNEGVDTTNKRSMTHLESQEAGIFQVSYDSLGVDHAGTLRALLATHGVTDAPSFIHEMKGNHALALEYTARLLRISYLWDGPIKRGEITTSLSPDALSEFLQLLAAKT